MEHDQKFGGSFNAHKNWKKLREKHEKNKRGEAPWRPETYVPHNGAGKGDMDRSMDVPKEIYSLNFDLAFGRITEKEHKKRTKEFWENLDK